MTAWTNWPKAIGAGWGGCCAFAEAIAWVSGLMFLPRQASEPVTS